MTGIKSFGDILAIHVIFQKVLFPFVAFILMLLFAFNLLYANPAVSLRVTPDEQSFKLGSYIAYIEDKQGAYSIEEVITLFSHSDAPVQLNYTEVMNMGLNTSTFWLHANLDLYDLDNTKELIWFLELSYPLLRSVEVFSVHEKSILSHQFLDSESEHSGILDGRNYIFDIKTFGKDQLDLILKVESHALATFPLTLWHPEAMAKHNRFVEYWLGFYFGLMAVMAFYNLVVFYVVRDRSYLYCVFYIVSTMSFFLVFSGVASQYFPGSAQYRNEHLPVVLAILSMAFSLKFNSEFISLKKYSRKIFQYSNVSFVLILLAALIAFRFPFEASMPTLFFVPFYGLMTIFMIMYALRRGSKEAAIILFSFSALLLSILIFSLAVFGILPFYQEGETSLYIGSAVHAVSLSLGLASQFNEERRKRYEALIRENQAVQSLRRMEELTTREAMLDPLTGLPNRAALERFSKEHLENKDGKKEPLAVLYIQLQSYYEINHTLGFRSSDLLIEKVSSRLNRLVSEMSDALAIRLSNNALYYVVRIDSASFVMLFRLKEDKQKYISSAQHLMALLNRPISIHDMKLDVKARVGMSFLPEHSTNIFTLVRFAQAALESDEENQAPVILYTSVVGQQASRKLKLINDLRIAIDNDELLLCFQPQIDIRENKVCSLEVLVRWQHPELGEVSPAEFIILAEQTGYIHEVTNWVLVQAFESLLWLMERGVKLNLAVNISAKDLSREYFHKHILDLLENYKLSPHLLTLELTETSLMRDAEYGIDILKALHREGVTIAIDDFGAGYSSLAYIKQLPISEIKIDRAYISQIDSLYSDRVITKSTISLAHEMGARVCAEGVETASSLKILSQFKCDLAQGFYIAKPMRRNELLIWLDESPFSA